MIEKRITIDRDLAIKGYRKAHRFTSLKNLAMIYSGLGAGIFFVVALTDIIFDSRHLLGVHFLAIFALMLILFVYSYFHWSDQMKTVKEYELDVILDDEGVTIKDNRKHIEWDEYLYFKEYDDYLEITNKSGEISLLPKRDEYADAIIFTKTKIPNREN